MGSGSRGASNAEAQSEPNRREREMHTTRAQETIDARHLETVSEHAMLTTIREKEREARGRDVVSKADWQSCTHSTYGHQEMKLTE